MYAQYVFSDWIFSLIYFDNFTPMYFDEFKTNKQESSMRTTRIHAKHIWITCFGDTPFWKWFLLLTVWSVKGKVIFFTESESFIHAVRWWTDISKFVSTTEQDLIARLFYELLDKEADHFFIL